MEASGRGAALASPAATDTTTKTAAVPDLDFILENGEVHQSRPINLNRQEQLGVGGVVTRSLSINQLLGLQSPALASHPSRH
jgi:hypothetical protein